MRFGNRARILLMSENSSAPVKATEGGADGIPAAPPCCYSRAELARHDGSDPGLPVLIAYKNWGSSSGSSLLDSCSMLAELTDRAPLGSGQGFRLDTLRSLSFVWTSRRCQSCRGAR